MGTFKRLLRSRKPYSAYRTSRAAQMSRKWTPVDEKRLEFYSKFIHPNDLCFDIGSNIGNRAKIFLKIVGPHGKVVLVEPQEHCMKILQKAFSRYPSIYFECKALGEKTGEAQLAISNELTVSSMSKNWINSVKKTGRFGPETVWDRSQKVEVTTLDYLIDTYGVPSFIKIDVEGYEKEVILGLSKSIQTCLSIEFTPEYLSSTFDCLDHLSQLGQISCNYSIGESMSFALPEWAPQEGIREALLQYESDIRFFGDVYIQLAPDCLKR
jgi:FkbM family methyltransferase